VGKWNPRNNENSTFSLIRARREEQIRYTISAVYDAENEMSVLDIHKLRVNEALEKLLIEMVILAFLSVICWFGISIYLLLSGFKSVDLETLQIMAWFNLMLIFSTDIVELVHLWLTPPSIGKPIW
jgi:ABC-type multidrug transport system fused ATPase/permease subunit